MTNREKNMIFMQKFCNSVLVRATCYKLKNNEKWNNLKFIDKLVYLRNKAVKMGIDLSK